MPILGNVIKRAIQLRKKATFKRGTPLQYQRRVLKKLLNNASETEFGKHYDFEKILSSDNVIKAFQNEVPLHNYNKIFKEWWSKEFEGEADICWPGKVKYFAVSSGTSEAASKYIPVTEDMLKTITRASMKQMIAMANFKLPSKAFEKQVLLLGSSTNLIARDTYYIGDMSGISMSRSVPFWFNRYCKPGKEILQMQDWSTKLNEIAKNARNWDIGIITGIPAWVQIMIEKVIEYNDAKNIHEIWPNLKVYIHGGIAFEPYRKTFEKLFSKPVTYIETYMASEGYFAFRSRPETTALKLILNNNIFYEFIPFDEKNFTSDGEIKENAEIHSIDEVQEDIDYALIISTCSGAWRYLLGDTIKFTDAKEKEILITGRTKHFLSICGEHLSVDNMNKAIKMTSEELDVELLEYTVQGIPYQNLFAHKWYIGAKDVENVDQKKLRHTLDNNLREVNDDYATERDNVLKEIIVEVIPNETFYSWMKDQGKEGDQNKFPRVMKKDKFSEWENFVKHTLAYKEEK